MIRHPKPTITVLVFVATIAVAAPSTAAADESIESMTALRAQLLSVAEPDLSPLDTTVAQQLEQAREEMETAIADPRATIRQLASAYGALGQIYHVRAAYLQSWGGPDTPLLWRFQGDVAGSGAHGDLNAHIIDAVRFVTGEEIVSVEGSIEHTFIEERALLEGGAGGEIAGAGASTSAGMGRSTVDDAVMFLGRMSGGGLASFEATRLATGYHNANRWEIHGEKGALRFDFERMNELGYYNLDGDGATQGWATIDVTRGGDGHPYADAWWPDSHGLGYEHAFVNQASDILTVIGGGKPLVPMPDFADALQTQRVLQAAIDSAREHSPATVPGSQAEGA